MTEETPRQAAKLKEMEAGELRTYPSTPKSAQKALQAELIKETRALEDGQRYTERARFRCKGPSQG